jgi:tetratricopeptide (TPR) repeat protein
LHTGRYDEAISAFAALARRRPASAEAARGHVRALMQVGRYEEAEKAARRFATENPSSPELWNSLGEVLNLRGRRSDAEEAFGKAVGADASDALDARLNLALLRYRRGEIETAMRDFETFVALYNAGKADTSGELTAVGTAVRYLGLESPQQFKDALRVYDEAIAADPSDLEPRIRVGELFLEKYNSADAAATFESVLQVDPSHPRALLGLARTRHFDGSPEARRLVERSLEVNPNLVPARVFRAELEIELENYDAASAEAREALNVNPASLDALAVLAAAHYLAGDSAGYEDARRRALDLNPAYAELYVRLAELSARNRLYSDAVEFGLEAVRLDAHSWSGYAVLGINQLRLGAMDEGRRSLETAFEGDPYDVWTKNTLDLLDDLDQYEEERSDRFIVAINRRDSDILSIYLTDLAERAYDSLSRRYGYAPATPIRVEVYPTHADFSVRTVGLVGLGALGVSFGPVIAMDSPSAREMGDFNWASTLWHEIAHTFHLGMSDGRVPRWFSEGLAVYEERRAHKGWGSNVTPGFLVAQREGKLLPLERLNNGFTRPVYPEQISHAYYEASLVCEFIEREFGAESLVRMLNAYGNGLSEEEVFRRVLGIGVEEIDKRFFAYLETRFAGPLASMRPGREGSERPTRVGIAARARDDTADFVAQLSYGHLLFESGEVDEAIQYLQRAKRLFPQYGEEGSPYWYLSRIYRQRGDRRAAEAELAALTEINARNYAAHRELAELREGAGDERGAAAALEGGVYVYPFEIELHERLAALYERLGENAGAVRERRAVLALDPANRAEALYRLARAYRQAGRNEEARGTVLRALEQAPGYEEALELLLEIRGGGSEE